MKKIVLVRHAKAIDRSEEPDDFNRSLVKKGQKQSKLISTKLLEKKLIQSPLLLISSPANRALETAEFFAETISFPKDNIQKEDFLYDYFSLEQLLSCIHKIDDKYSDVLFFGHNPAFSDMAFKLLQSFYESMPKGAAVGISFEIKAWNQVEPKKGELAFYEYPKKYN